MDIADLVPTEVNLDTKIVDILGELKKCKAKDINRLIDIEIAVRKTICKMLDVAVEHGSYTDYSIDKIEYIKETWVIYYTLHTTTDPIDMVFYI